MCPHGCGMNQGRGKGQMHTYLSSKITVEVVEEGPQFFTFNLTNAQWKRIVESLGRNIVKQTTFCSTFMQSCKYNPQFTLVCKYLSTHVAFHLCNVRLFAFVMRFSYFVNKEGFVKMKLYRSRKSNNRPVS